MSPRALAHRRFALLICLALGSAGLAVLLARGLFAAPVYDDIDLIRLAGSQGLAEFALSALPFDASYWRPIPMALFWLARRAGSWGPLALASGLAFAILGVLAAELWREIHRVRPASIWAWALCGAAAPALLAHPALAGLWSWQSAVFDLCLCLGLALGWAGLRRSAGKGAALSGLVALAFTLWCALSKEALIPIAGLALIAGLDRPRGGERMGIALGAAAGLMIALMSRWLFLDSLASAASAQPSALELAPRALAGYLASLAGLAPPSWASAYDATPISVWAGAAAGALALAGAWRASLISRRMAVLTLAQIGLMCAALAGGLVSGDGHYAARHLAFAPLLLGLALAPALLPLTGRAGRAAAIGCAALFVIWGAAGARESGFWRSSEAFWSRALDLSPNSPVAAGWRVGELKKEGRFEEAMALCRRVVPVAAAGPLSAPATGLGYFCSALALERGSPAEALGFTRSFQSSWPRAPELAYLAGLASLRQEDRAGAEAAFGEALRFLRAMPPGKKGAERQAIEKRLSVLMRPSSE